MDFSTRQCTLMRAFSISYIPPDSAFTAHNDTYELDEYFTLCKGTVWRGITDILHVTYGRTLYKKRYEQHSNVLPR